MSQNKNAEENGHEMVYLPTASEKNEKNIKLKHEKEPNESNWVFLYCTAITANLITLGSAIAFSWPSPVIPRLNGNLEPESNPIGRPITAFEESWINGLLSLGGACGPPIINLIMDRIGRKRTLLLLSFPMLTSYITSAFASNVFLFYITRFTLGLSVGSVFTVAPLYLNEISEDKNRGTIGCFLGIFVSLGSLFVFCIGPFVSIKLFCLSCAVPVIIFVIIFALFMPETPTHLIAIDNIKEAEISLRKLRGNHFDIKKELYKIQESLSGNLESVGFLQMFKNKIAVRVLIISCSLMCFQQFSGINAVLSYMQSIFDAAGSQMSSKTSSLIIAFIQMITNVVATFLIDKAGRRILMILSLGLLGISLISLGTFFYLKDNFYDVSSLGWLPIASLIVYIIGFNSGIGVIPWTISGEMFPSNVKSVACTTSAVFCFSASFLMTYFYPLLATYIGLAQSFWLFAFSCLGGVVFVYFLVPETKGKSAQEIQQMLRKMVL